MNRPTWDEYFMDMARLASKRATCIRRQVGAVITRGNQVIATGYNGAPAGLAHCTDTTCIREQLKVPSGERHELCRAAHAEQNAICQAAKHGHRTEGGTLYVTVSPCSICAKMIINAGIKRVVSGGEYPSDMAQDMLETAGIEMQFATSFSAG